MDNKYCQTVIPKKRETNEVSLKISCLSAGGTFQTTAQETESKQSTEFFAELEREFREEKVELIGKKNGEVRAAQRMSSRNMDRGSLGL